MVTARVITHPAGNGGGQLGIMTVSDGGDGGIFGGVFDGGILDGNPKNGGVVLVGEPVHMPVRDESPLTYAGTNTIIEPGPPQPADEPLWPIDVNSNDPLTHPDGIKTDAPCDCLWGRAHRNTNGVCDCDPPTWEPTRVPRGPVKGHPTTGPTGIRNAPVDPLPPVTATVDPTGVVVVGHDPVPAATPAAATDSILPDTILGYPTKTVLIGGGIAVGLLALLSSSDPTSGVKP